MSLGLLKSAQESTKKVLIYLYMSIKACPVEGCVLLQVGGINILNSVMQSQTELMSLVQNATSKGSAFASC